MTTATLPRELAALRPHYPPRGALRVATAPRCRRHPAPKPRYIQRPAGRRTPSRWDDITASRSAEPGPSLAYCLLVILVDLTKHAAGQTWAWLRREWSWLWVTAVAAVAVLAFAAMFLRLIPPGAVLLIVAGCVAVVMAGMSSEVERDSGRSA